MIHQLIYYSRNSVPGDDRAMLANMREILGASQRNNKRDDITGFLIFDKTWFVQVLEGEKAKVTETYDRIATDPRHGGTVVMSTRDTPMRSFPNWSMGGALRSPEVQEVYLENGIGGDLDPAKLKGEQILQLALDLQAFEQAKRQGIKAAG
jgi:hypothetical protein